MFPAKQLPLVFALLLLTLRQTFVTGAPAKKPTDVEVIVIGAGAAGIMAASDLAENGYRVKILEAQNRAGGRVWSVSYGDGFVELGAQVVWGNESSLFKFVTAENLLLNVSGGAKRSNVNLVQTGGQVSKPEVIAKINQIKADLNKILQNLKVQNNPELSLGENLDDAFGEYLKTSEDPALAEAVYDYWVRALKTEDSVDSLYDLSLHTFTDRTDGDSRHPLRVPYIEVLRRLGQHIPQKAYILGQTVVKITFEQSEKKPVTVTTKEGRTFKAHHVIVTLPLGVLKRDEEALFSPALPQKMKNAIAAAGFGTLGKVILIYEKPFWEQLQPHIANMPLLWTEDKNVDPERRYVNRWWTRGIDELKIFSSPSPSFALSGFIGGRHAEEMETMSDAKVIANLTALISQFTGLQVPAPRELLRGNWHSNPHFTGTFSHISQQFTEQGFKISDLAEPLWSYKSEWTDGQVFGLLFAGEATHDTYFSHVNGAVESGTREAARIHDYYKV